VAGRGPVILVDAKSLTDLGRSVTELRDRTLFSGLEPRDVKRVRLTGGGKTLVVERRGDSDWRMVEPTKGGAKGSKVEDLLYTLRSLKWTEMASPQGADAPRYGLDAPSLTITLLKGDGNEVASLIVGKREDGRAYAKAGKAPTIYSLDAKQLGEAPKIPDDFQG
jgi:hypothetical protein